MIRERQDDGVSAAEKEKRYYSTACGDGYVDLVAQQSTRTLVSPMRPIVIPNPVKPLSSVLF